MDGATGEIAPMHWGVCLATLPTALLARFLALLPADARLRCAEVCRGWRDAVADPSLWVSLDLSVESGGLARPANAALLRAAVARLGGNMQSLTINGCEYRLPHEALLAAVEANAGALRTLRLFEGPLSVCLSRTTLVELEALCRAAPRLHELHADAACEAGDEARRVLRCDTPLGSLRLHALRVNFYQAGEPNVRALLLDLAAHAPPSLVALTLNDDHMREPVESCIDALVDFALTRRLAMLALINFIDAACVPAVCRLLRGSAALRTLSLGGFQTLVLDVPSAVQLAGALRANTTLVSLRLGGAVMWGDAVAAAALLGALTGHPSLSTLALNATDADEGDELVVGALLGALVAANAPALRVLDVSYMYCGDARLAQFVAALPANTHLRELDVCECDLSTAFMRSRLLPAVRANTSLRMLHVDNRNGDDDGVVRELAALVESRATHELM